MNPSPRLCAQCKSELIIIRSVTEKLDGSIFPQTITYYRCSNAVCQEERDKETNKRLKQKQEKEIADLHRAQERARKRLRSIKERITP